MTDLARLKKQIAREKAKLREKSRIESVIAERKRLQRELALLKSPGKRKIYSIAKRTGRGLSILGKKVGKQAVKIREAQIEEARRVRGKKKKGFTYDPMNLDF
jgi:hypothetical protein